MSIGLHVKYLRTLLVTGPQHGGKRRSHQRQHYIRDLKKGVGRRCDVTEMTVADEAFVTGREGAW
jgi:hypothetical protein